MIFLNCVYQFIFLRFVVTTNKNKVYKNKLQEKCNTASRHWGLKYTLLFNRLGQPSAQILSTFPLDFVKKNSVSIKHIFTEIYPVKFYLIRDILRNLGIKKATGPKGTPNILLKKCTSQVLIMLVVFNRYSPIWNYMENCSMPKKAGKTYHQTNALSLSYPTSVH